MRDRTRSGRSLEQLEALLDEPAEWGLFGPQGVLVGQTPNLRLAVEAAMKAGSGGSRVVAITLAPANDIIIYASQIASLALRIAR